MIRWRVVKAHQATYADPIAFASGDTVRLTGREDIWDGHRWLWAVAPDGREGWIPDSFAGASAEFTATVAYSAIELTCAPGEVLTGDCETHGWVWATNASGQSGWAPLNVLDPISGPPKPDGGPS